MKIPSFLQEKFVDENGYLTPAWAAVIDQLLAQLQENAGDEGLVPPSLSSDPMPPINNQFSQLTEVSNGTMIYDTYVDKLKVYIAGVFKEIVTM